MNRILLIACWLIVLAGATYLRFENLGERPFHADEATGARLTAKRIEGEPTFDPKHYHGPTQSMVAAAVTRIAGQSRWEEMEKHTLRLAPAAAGSLVVLIPVFLRRRIGDGAALTAAALIGCSPLLVYYSRTFIHEMLLCLFGMAALVCLLTKPKHVLPGVFLGLMFATKETVAITALAAGFALVCVWAGTSARKPLADLMREWRGPLVCWGVSALLVAALLYTDAFRHPKGLIDAFATFLQYQTGEGHEKHGAYYLKLLAAPAKPAGHWWFGTPVVLLALVALLRAYGNHDSSAFAARFIGLAILGHLVIYSFIAYKTPWLMCLPWALTCLLAACSIRPGDNMKSIIGIASALVLTLVTQTRQTTIFNGRLASDPRNPLAYVPTRRDVENLGTWLETLRTLEAPGSFPCAVVGAAYWPLPWYLRRIETIGYYGAVSAEMNEHACVIAMPEVAAETAALLESSHVALPRGLRADVPIIVHLRKDIWETWTSQP